MKQLTPKAFADYLAEAAEKIRQDGFSIVKDKPINYGQQIAVQFCEAKASVNIYNGKKGLTHVYNGDSALKQRLMLVLEGVQNASEELQPAAAGATVSNGLWAGSDESGKGDFFGSLVVAATVVDNTTAAKLQAAGVKDCKLLTDKKILELEDVIKATVVDYSVLELKPKIYNLRYEQVAAAGGKLNQLLGYGHVAALSQVLERQKDCHSALIDQFTQSTVNLKALQQRFPAACRAEAGKLVLSHFFPVLQRPDNVYVAFMPTIKSTGIPCHIELPLLSVDEILFVLQSKKQFL